MKESGWRRQVWRSRPSQSQRVKSNRHSAIGNWDLGIGQKSVDSRRRRRKCTNPWGGVHGICNLGVKKKVDESKVYNSMYPSSWNLQTWKSTSLKTSKLGDKKKAKSQELRNVNELRVGQRAKRREKSKGNRHSAFGQGKVIGIRHSAFGNRHLGIGIRQSAFGIWESGIGIRQSAFGIWETGKWENGFFAQTLARESWRKILKLSD